MTPAHASDFKMLSIRQAPFQLWKVYLSLIRPNVKQPFQKDLCAFRLLALWHCTLDRHDPDGPCKNPQSRPSCARAHVAVRWAIHVQE